MNYLADNKKRFFDSFSEQFNGVLTEQKNKAISEQDALKTKTEQERERIKREYQNNQRAIIETQDKCKKNIVETLNRKLAEWQQLARRTITLMPPYVMRKQDNIHCLCLQNNEIPTIERLYEEQNNRIFLPAIPIGIKDIELNGIHHHLPIYADWQGKNNEQRANLYITYEHTDACKDQAYALHETILMRILAAFPVGKVHFTFINPHKQSQYGSKWILEQMSFKSIDTILEKGEKNERSLLINKLFNGKDNFDNQEDIRQAIRNLQGRASDITQLLSSTDKSLCDYNRRQQRIEQHYEIVVLYEPFSEVNTSWFSEWKNMIKSEYTTKGIYSIVLQSNKDNALFNKDYALEKDRKEMQCFFDEHFLHIECSENAICHINNQECTNITAFENSRFFNIFCANGDSSLQQNFINKLLDALSNEEKKAQSLRRAPHEQWLEKEPVDTWDEKNYFSVPIGRVNGEVFNFELGDESRVHSFILGQTGSGKSIFMENLIVAATAKYTPRSLHLYLIDFKDGVTINPYANLPHVQCTIASGDKTVQYVMLQKIENERQRRNKLFTDKGGTLNSYNKQQANEADKLPRIVILYDEFSMFFIQDSADTINRTKDPLQNLINQILETIATQGRSAGIHLVMVSQSLSKVAVEELITQSSTNSYILRGTDKNDGGKLFRNSEGATNAINQLDKIDRIGMSAYISKGNIGLLELYLLDKGVGEEHSKKHQDIIQGIVKKYAQTDTNKKALRCSNFKYPSSGLPPCYNSYKDMLPADCQMIIGTDIMGQQIVGFSTFDNVLICSEDSPTAKDTTLRLMWSLMQTTFARLGHHKERQETYVGNLTKNPRVRLEGIDYIGAFYEQNYAQRCERPEDINNTLIYLYKALKKREAENREQTIPLFFYIFDSDAILDNLDNKQPVDISNRTETIVVSTHQGSNVQQGIRTADSFAQHRQRSKSVTTNSTVLTIRQIYVYLLQEGFKYGIYIVRHTTKNQKDLLQTTDFPYKLFLHTSKSWNNDKIELFEPRKLGTGKNARVLVINTNADKDKGECVEQLAIPFTFPNTDKEEDNY